MSFWDRFESKQDGVNDTVEFVIRVAIVTLAAVILVVVVAFVIALLAPNILIDSKVIIETINPAFQTIIGAFVGLLGGLSLNANARDKEEPVEPVAPEPEPVAPVAPVPVGVGGFGTVTAASAPVDLTPDMVVSHSEEATPVVSHEEPVLEDDDDDMEPWEKYRNDLRYDANGDGVVDEADFPDWRNPRQ